MQLLFDLTFLFVFFQISGKLIMENVWEKLKALKGRPWTDTKNILNKFMKGYLVNVFLLYIPNYIFFF